jgi:hypothetical protein
MSGERPCCRPAPCVNSLDGLDGALRNDSTRKMVRNIGSCNHDIIPLERSHQHDTDGRGAKTPPFFPLCEFSC